MEFSPGSLFASVLIGAVGFGLFQYGRKQQRIPQLVTGVALMGYPYFVASVGWMLVVGAVLLAGLYAAIKSGL